MNKKRFIILVVISLTIIVTSFYFFKERKIGEVTYNPIPTIEGSDEYYEYEKNFLTYNSDVGFSFQYPPHMFVENKFEPNELYIWPKFILENKSDPYGGIHIEMTKNENQITAIQWLKNKSGRNLSEGYNVIDIDGQEAVTMDGGTWVVVNTPNNKYRLVISLLWDENGSQSMTEEGIIISSLKFTQ
jgi:hypothetical protein